jgi:hypothetical protein
MPSWKELYKACCLETDPEKLRALILETEGAMFSRAQELGMNGDGQAEREEMEDASVGLLGLKTQRLGWPGPKSKVTGEDSL